jgi:hypothetical protein
MHNSILADLGLCWCVGGRDSLRVHETPPANRGKGGASRDIRADPMDTATHNWIPRRRISLGMRRESEHPGNRISIDVIRSPILNLQTFCCHHAFPLQPLYYFESGCLLWHPFCPTYNVTMPYDSYSEEPEPKLLTLDCFPIFFAPPAPPNYEVIMAANTRYHRLPEEDHASFEAPNRDPELLLGPLSHRENPTSPKKEHKFSYHPTLFLRLIVVGLLIASLVLFLIARRPRSLSAIIFVCIVLIRNILVVFHNFVARFIRIRIDVELIDRPSDPKKPARGCPSWLKTGPIHVAVDLILAFILLITVIIATQGSYYWYYKSVIPACILSWVAM